MNSNVRNLFEKRGAPVDASDEPPHDGGMEARVAKLEAAVEHVQEDIRDIKADLRAFRADTSANFRWVLGAMSGGFIILLGAMAHGFHWL